MDAQEARGAARDALVRLAVSLSPFDYGGQPAEVGTAIAKEDGDLTEAGWAFAQTLFEEAERHNRRLQALRDQEMLSDAKEEEDAVQIVALTYLVAAALVRLELTAVKPAFLLCYVGDQVRATLRTFLTKGVAHA